MITVWKGRTREERIRYFDLLTSFRFAFFPITTLCFFQVSGQELRRNLFGKSEVERIDIAGIKRERNATWTAAARP